ncbi:MAG: uncharacterized membrane protein HdeD (DUF308 family) [Verrucomicrobiales bacterium]|jgi:uncharacterized membrane protein HdeD (DUF308 family)
MSSKIPQSSIRYSWISLIAGAIPLVGYSFLIAEIVFAKRFFDSAAASTLILVLLISAFTAIIYGIRAMANQNRIDGGWPRLRAAFGIAMGAIGILASCVLSALLYASLSW